MKLGDLIRGLREGGHLKQENIVKILKKTNEFSQGKLSRIENNHLIPDFIITCRIAQMFNIEPNEIWEKIKDDPAYRDMRKIKYPPKELPGVAAWGGVRSYTQKCRSRHLKNICHPAISRRTDHNSEITQEHPYSADPAGAQRYSYDMDRSM